MNFPSNEDPFEMPTPENAAAQEAPADDAGENAPAQDGDPASGYGSASAAQDHDEIGKWKDLALRGQAELENFRKRMAREKLDAIKFGNASLLESLLPILDNFRFGLDAARQESESSVVFQGMSMVMKQLADFLADHGVSEYGETGETFDPNLHEAVQLEHSDTLADGLILTVLRKGYRLHDRLLRAANVIVSKGPATGTPEEGTPEPS